MKRQSGSYTVANPQLFKQQALSWANSHSHVAYLDNNAYPDYPGASFECIIGIGVRSNLQCNVGDAFRKLHQYQQQTQDWLFGYLGYDLKNEIEALESNLPDGTGFPDLYFFQPEHLITVQLDGNITIESATELPEDILSQVEATTIPHYVQQSVAMKPRMSKEQYLHTIQQLREHISAGDVYEINYCQEFYAEGVNINPLLVFAKLNQLSQAPFSCYLKLEEKYLLCASPERFMRKQGDLVSSMPIKGTTRRGKDAVEDEALKHELRLNIKEQAENVMIVDLVRNDLTRSCIPGTIQVDELFGIKTFPKVHHMVSTVSGQLRADVAGIAAIRNAFPMGSMTGAPKVRVMQLTEQYEHSKRGIYSGAAGYFTPNGDFDLNVVIRSLVYNQASQYLSYHVGGAITWDSVPELEYEECLLKAATIEAVLEA
ncbi:anthranilate synthase component I family protein [soil metagenome]